jgi:hypothetical protein
MNSTIKNFTIEDYPSAFKLWQTDDKVGLSSADARENIEFFLKRNPGLSKVAIANSNVRHYYADTMEGEGIHIICS